MATAHSSVFIGLGSNIEAEANLPAATALLAALVRITAVSPVYRTPPWGEPEQPDFLNAVAAAETALAPLALLEGLLAIEARLRRKRGRRWGPRTADLDLLSYGDLELADERLTLPHPRLHERAFVLLPWRAIAPHFVVPGRDKSVSDLLAGVDVAGIRPAALELAVAAGLA